MRTLPSGDADPFYTEVTLMIDVQSCFLVQLNEFAYFVRHIWSSGLAAFSQISISYPLNPPLKGPLGHTGQIFILPLPFLGESACVCKMLSVSDHRRRHVYAWRDRACTHRHTHTHSPIQGSYSFWDFKFHDFS